MNWWKYQVRSVGECCVDYKGEGLVAPFEIGFIETGRQRVFSGHFVRVKGPDAEEWIGESPYSPLAALRDADELAAGDGARFLCAGLHHDFYETGLSTGTGFGYLKGDNRPIHMMERPPLPPANPCTSAAKLLARLRMRNPDI